MQINPVLLNKDETADYLVSVLNRIELAFEIDVFSLCEKHNNSFESISQDLLSFFSIRELKKMTNSLTIWFETSELPKRNSKVSLSRWIAELFLYIQSPIVEEPLMIASDEAFVHEPGQNTLCNYTAPGAGIEVLEIEVLEPEGKPIYTIVICADRHVLKERVNALPPYLVDSRGELFLKAWSSPCDATYSQLTAEHLSNIVVAGKHNGNSIQLMTENLVSCECFIRGEHPPFIIDEQGGVYKRMKRMFYDKSPLPYAQVISEHLSNIIVVPFAQ